MNARHSKPAREKHAGMRSQWEISQRRTKQSIHSTATFDKGLMIGNMKMKTYHDGCCLADHNIARVDASAGGYKTIKVHLVVVDRSARRSHTNQDVAHT